MTLFKRQVRFPNIGIPPATRFKLIQAVIVTGVVGLSSILGRMFSDEDLLIPGLVLLGLGVAGVAALFLAEHLSWSPILLLITAAFTPFSLPTGTQSRIADSMVVAMLFTVLWVLRMLVVEKRFHLVKTAANLPLMGFMAVSAISMIWSIVFRDPQVYIWDSFPLVQAASTVLMILLPAAFLLVTNFVDRPAQLYLMVILIVVAGVIGLVANLTGINLPVNLGGLFSTWVLAICTALVMFSKRINFWIRFALLLIAAGWFYWGFVRGITWVAGWLPGLIAIMVLTFFRSRKLFFFLVLVFIVIVIIFNGYFMERLEAERQESGVTRVAAWEVNWRVTSQHLLFGTGPGGYAVYYMTYYPQQGTATHNNYLDVVAQTGVVGLGLWLWFFVSVAWQGFRLVRKLRGRGDFLEGMANAAFAGTIACIIIMMFGDWLLPFAYTQTIAGFDYAVYSWMFIGTVVAIDRMVQRQAGESVHA